MYCGECGYKNKKGSLFCEECGAKLEIEEVEDVKEETIEEEKDVVFCPNCGTENLSNALFCESCGSKLSEDEEEESGEMQPNVSSFSSSQEVLSKPKKSKKNIIVIIVLLLVIVLGCGVYFGRDYIINFFSEEELEIDWGNTYYLYLKDIKSDENKLTQAGLSSNMEDGKIAFYETDVLDDPVMVITYTEGVTEYTNIYYITKDDEENSSVNVIINEDTDMDIELLYEIESEEYNYYVHTTNVSSDSYETLDSVLNTIINGGIDTSMFVELDADTLEDIFEKNDDKLYFVYMGKSTNETCQEFIPVLQKSVTEYAYDLYYLELGNLTSDDSSKIKSLSDDIKDNYNFSPMIYIIKNGEVIDYHRGSMDYDSYVELLEKHEVSESKEKTKTTTASYTFTSDDSETIEVDGEEVTLTGFDKTFVEVDVDMSADFDINSENSEIKELISTSSNDFKKKDEIITDKVKENIQEQVNDIEEIKDKIEESTPKTFQVGNYTLEFGTYTGSDSYNGATDDTAIWCDLKVVLKSDFTFEMTYYNIDDGRDDEVVTGTFAIDTNIYGTGCAGIIFYEGEETTPYRAFGVSANNSFEQLAGSGYKYTLVS